MHYNNYSVLHTYGYCDRVMTKRSVDKELWWSSILIIIIIIENSCNNIAISLTVGTARYIMITLDVARAFNKSDINPVMIAPIENKAEYKLHAFLVINNIPR